MPEVLLNGSPDLTACSENVQYLALKSVRRRTAGTGLVAEVEMTVPTLFNPATGPRGAYERQRTFPVLKRSTLVSAAGDATVWTPASGKAVRLIGFSVIMDPATTTAAGSLVTLKDITVANVVDDVLALPIAATNNPFRAVSILPGNGVLFPTGDALGINLSAAATAGGVYVNLLGCEE